MNRRTFVGALACALLTALHAAKSQSARESHRIGFLFSGSRTGSSRLVEGFRQGLRELGWVEGQNIVSNYRFAEGRFERLPDFAAELVQLNVDVIVAWATSPAVAAKKATTRIPIVMVGVGNPVGLGLIASLAQPGGNVTGLSFSIGALATGKGLELLKETVPQIRRVAVLSNPGNPSHALAIREVEDAAPVLRVQPQLLTAREPNQFGAAFAAMAKGRAEALLVVPDSMFVLHRAPLADLATKNRLPSMYGVREHVESGGLMSYGPNVVADSRRATLFIDKILRGAKPADLPVEQPTTFELVINLRTAKAIGLRIPPSLLQRADQVIE